MNKHAEPEAVSYRPSVNKIGKLLLIAAGFLLALTGFEVFLRANAFGLLNETFIWMPREAHAIQNVVEARKRAYAAHNEFGFTDRPRTRKKTAKGRIVVLGDSFIWGSGLDTSQVWSHILERMIRERSHGDIEVMSWGARGWATVDQLQFLKDTGSSFDIDVLLMGFVTNDPDVYIVPGIRVFTWQNSPVFSPITRLFPETFSFFYSYTNNILERYVMTDMGYVNWEVRLYSPENLAEYQKVLHAVARHCAAHGIKLYFVLTPNNTDPVFQDRFRTVSPLFHAAGIKTLNLYPAVARRLADRKTSELRANRADGHPGPLMTQVFAEEVMASLESEGILDQLARRIPEK